MNIVKILRVIFLFLSTFYFFIYTVSAQWGPDTRLTFYDSVSYTGYRNSRCVGTDDSNRVHVCFWDKRDGNFEIYYKRWNGVWEPDVRLTFDSLNSETPSIAVEKNGKVHIVWMDDRDGNWEIYYKKFNGTDWEADTRLTNDLGYSFFPQVACDNNGKVHVVWEDERDGNWEIYYRRWNSGWEPETRISFDPMNSEYPSIAVDSLGKTHIVWQDNRDGNNEIYYNGNRITFDSGRSEKPSICVDKTGKVHVSWHDDRDGGWEIYYKRWNGVWESDTRLTFDVDSSTWSLYPSIVADNSGKVHVVWEDMRELISGEIYYKRWNGVWEPDTRLTYDGWYSWYPSCAVDKLGDVHVVWQDSRAGWPNWEVFYKRTYILGVEEKIEDRRQKSEVRITATPNPFSSFATISGYEKEKFLVYDITGKLVGIYKGERVGEDLSAGFYFIKIVNSQKPSAISRILKVR